MEYNKMIQRFEKVHELKNDRITTWAKILVSNFLMLRERGYERKEQEKPKTLKQIHNDFQNELAGIVVDKH